MTILPKGEVGVRRFHWDMIRLHPILYPPESNVVVSIELRLIIDVHAKIAERINSK
jgi:hypothetical protein